MPRLRAAPLRHRVHSVNFRKALNIEDLHVMAQRLLLRVAYDFLARGTDVVKALAPGANMVFVGRATLFGAAAGGEAGALRALKLLGSEVDRVLGLLGCNSVEQLNPEYLRIVEALPVGHRPVVSGARRMKVEG